MVKGEQIKAEYFWRDAMYHVAFFVKATDDPKGLRRWARACHPPILLNKAFFCVI